MLCLINDVLLVEVSIQSRSVYGPYALPRAMHASRRLPRRSSMSIALVLPRFRIRQSVAESGCCLYVSRSKISANSPAQVANSANAGLATAAMPSSIESAYLEAAAPLREKRHSSQVDVAKTTFSALECDWRMCSQGLTERTQVRESDVTKCTERRRMAGVVGFLLLRGSSVDNGTGNRRRRRPGSDRRV